MLNAPKKYELTYFIHHKSRAIRLVKTKLRKMFKSLIKNLKNDSGFFVFVFFLKKKLSITRHKM